MLLLLQGPQDDLREPLCFLKLMLLLLLGPQDARGLRGTCQGKKMHI